MRGPVVPRSLVVAAGFAAEAAEALLQHAAVEEAQQRAADEGGAVAAVAALAAAVQEGCEMLADDAVQGGARRGGTARARLPSAFCTAPAPEVSGPSAPPGPR